MTEIWSSNDGQSTISFSPDRAYLLADGRVVVIGYPERQRAEADRLPGDGDTAIIPHAERYGAYIYRSEKEFWSSKNQ